MTLISRRFNKKVELYRATSAADGSGGFILNAGTLVKELWADITERNASNYDEAGISQNLKEVIITVRQADLNTNENYFVYKNQKYQINEITSNNKESQFTCLCQATNF